MAFTHNSVGKESACNAGDPGSIPGSGRSSGEGVAYPLQYSWASFVIQQVKKPLAMRVTWVWSLGWENPLEKGKATHSSILAWRIPWTLHGVAKSRTWLSDFHFTFVLVSAIHQHELAIGIQMGKLPTSQSKFPLAVYFILYPDS